jgi:hypothetical protein
VLFSDSRTEQMGHDGAARYFDSGFAGSGFDRPLRARSGRILVARRPDSGRPACMGAKYYPTEKDRKLNQRFQQKQNPLPKFKNSTGKAPAKKSKGR